jgi:hypothetical protein
MMEARRGLSLALGAHEKARREAGWKGDMGMWMVKFGALVAVVAISTKIYLNVGVEGKRVFLSGLACGWLANGGFILGWLFRR